MIEVWKKNDVVQKVEMGCKQANACNNQRQYNFWDYLTTHGVDNSALIAAREASDVYKKFTVCKPEQTYNYHDPISKCTLVKKLRITNSITHNLSTLNYY